MRDIKEKTARNRVYARNKATVNRWWLNRIEAGTLIDIPGYPVIGYDVQGEGPWYPYVATEVLKTALFVQTGLELDRMGFIRLWGDVTRLKVRVKRKAFWPITDGVRQSEYRQFVRVLPIEQCKALIA